MRYFYVKPAFSAQYTKRPTSRPGPLSLQNKASFTLCEEKELLSLCMFRQKSLERRAENGVTGSHTIHSGRPPRRGWKVIWRALTVIGVHFERGYKEVWNSQTFTGDTVKQLVYISIVFE